MVIYPWMYEDVRLKRQTMLDIIGRRAFALWGISKWKVLSLVTPCEISEAKIS